jgi:hypothetical protein
VRAKATIHGECETALTARNGPFAQGSTTLDLKRMLRLTPLQFAFLASVAPKPRRAGISDRFTCYLRGV